MSLKFGQQLGKEARRADIARRAAQGQSLRFIASDLAVSVATVRRDLEIVRAEWRDSALSAMGDRVAAHLAAIAEVKREAFAAFERSKLEEVDTVTVVEYEIVTGTDGKQSRKPVGQRTTRHVRQRLPEVKYLDTVLRALARESKLLGLDKAPPRGAKTIINAPNAGPIIAIDVDKLTIAELEVLEGAASKGVIEHKPTEGTPGESSN